MRSYKGRALSGKNTRVSGLFAFTMIFVLVLAVCVIAMGYIIVRNDYPVAGTIVPEYPADCTTEKNISGSEASSFFNAYVRRTRSSVQFYFACGYTSIEPGFVIRNVLTTDNKVVHDDLLYGASASFATTFSVTCNVSKSIPDYVSIDCGRTTFKMYL
jgi:hypothetical protein